MSSVCVPIEPVDPMSEIDRFQSPSPSVASARSVVRRSDDSVRHGAALPYDAGGGGTPGAAMRAAHRARARAEPVVHACAEAHSSARERVRISLNGARLMCARLSSAISHTCVP